MVNLCFSEKETKTWRAELILCISYIICDKIKIGESS